MDFNELTAEEFKNKIDNSKEAIIIDVRTPEEKSEGDIPGSVLMNIMNPDFSINIEKLDRDKEYFVFCRSGGRSSSACHYMTNKGFKKCYNLLGGIMAWNAKFKSK